MKFEILAIVLVTHFFLDRLAEGEVCRMSIFPVKEMIQLNLYIQATMTIEMYLRGSRHDDCCKRSERSRDEVR